jgi:hypothetical protein
MCALDALQFDWRSLDYKSMMLTSRSSDLFGASFGGSRMTMSQPWPAPSAATGFYSKHVVPEPQH